MIALACLALAMRRCSSSKYLKYYFVVAPCLTSAILRDHRIVSTPKRSTRSETAQRYFSSVDLERKNLLPPMIFSVASRRWRRFIGRKEKMEKRELKEIPGKRRRIAPAL
jgi:hypothetical protein